MNIVAKVRSGSQPIKQRASTFARNLLAEWKRLGLPNSEAHIVVAVSGGADSTALLLAFDELISEKRLELGVTVAHLDHGLRQQSKQDATWVNNLAQQLGFEIELSRANVRKRATATGDNLEQAARRSRYEFLAAVAKKRNAKMI